MKRLIIVFYLLFLTTQSAYTQEVASFYFNGNLLEYTAKYPSLTVTNKQGEYSTEIVPKLGSIPRKVYQFPKSSGLVFNYSKIKNFIKGSYAVEMYFRYDDAELLMYGMIIGENSKSRQGEFVHLVTTRDFISKKVNIFLDGELKTTFYDEDDLLAIEPNSEFIFFTKEDTETTSGAVAMIKIYNSFIDEEKAKVLFEPFIIEEVVEKPSVSLKNYTLKRLYFVQSEATLLPESIPELEALKKMLMDNPSISIFLIGHTDNQGDFNLNLKLSKERADSVKAFLIENGIKSNRIKTKGYGGTRPIASNNQELTRRLNRRVEMEIIK